MQIDTENLLHFTAESFVGKSAGLLGITGSGKTNTAAVLIEELLSSGLPMTIVDIEGEYWGLKERFEILVAGRSEHSELILNPENAGALARTSIERGISVILDLSEYSEEEQVVCLMEYFTALWAAASKVKRPYQVILEEAHEWLPEGVRTPLKTLLTRIALRGRKRGLSIILMSQRSAKVAKDVLTQTSLLFLHRVVHPTDMKVYKDLIPLPSAEVEQIVGALHPGQVVAVSNHIPQVAQIRLRYTFHAGSTPVLGEDTQPELRQIDEQLLRELQHMIAASSPAAKDEKRKDQRIKELESLLVERDAEIAQLKRDNALLSQLSVTMNGKIESAVFMPETMQVAQASIEQATIHQVQAPSMHPVVVESDVPVPKQVSAPATPINEAKVKSLKRRLEQLGARQYQIVKLLVERDATMTIDEIAAWMNLDRSTVSRNMPPDAIFKIGLLSRSKRGSGYIYRSTLKTLIAKEFPGASVEQIQLFR